MALPRPSKLVQDIVRVVYDLTKDRKEPYWVDTGSVLNSLGLAYGNKTNEAFGAAIARNLLRSDGGHPPLSVCVTHHGITLARKK